MDNFAALAGIVLSTGVILERLVEISFDTVERMRNLPQEVLNSDDYKQKKRLIASLLVLALGPVVTLGFANAIGLSSEDWRLRLLVGLAAGALAPYAHALLELVNSAKQQLGDNQAPPAAGAASQAPHQ